jgi:hypothetical protein
MRVNVIAIRCKKFATRKQRPSNTKDSSFE